MMTTRDAVIHFHGNDGDVIVPISKFVMWTTSKVIKYMIQGHDDGNESDDNGNERYGSAIIESQLDNVAGVDGAGRTIIPIVNTAFKCDDMVTALRFLHEQRVDAEHVTLKNNALPVLVYLECTDAHRVHNLAKYRVSQLTRYHAFLMHEVAYGKPIDPESCTAEQAAAIHERIWPDSAGNLMHPFMEFIASINPLEWMPLTRKKLVTEESVQIVCVLLFYTKPTPQHAERMYMIIKHFLTTPNVQYHRFFPALFRFFVAVGCRATTSEWHHPFKDIMGRLFPLDFFASKMDVLLAASVVSNNTSPVQPKYAKGIWTMECEGHISWYVATIPLPYSTTRTERVDIDRAPMNVDIKVQNRRYLDQRTVSVTVILSDTYRQPRYSEQDVYVWVWSNVDDHEKKCYRIKLGHMGDSRHRKIREVYSFNAISARKNINNKQVFVAIAILPLQKAYLDYCIPICGNAV